MLVIFVGFLGFILLLIAYALCLFGKITQESCVFNIMNVIGAIFIAYHAYMVDGWIITSLPLLWAAVSLYYIVFKKPCNNGDVGNNKKKKMKK